MPARPHWAEHPYHIPGFVEQSFHINANQASSEKTYSPTPTRPHLAKPLQASCSRAANQSLSGRASTPTPNQVSLGKSSAFTPTPHRAEPLHQRQPGLTGQSFHTNSNQASLGRASEPTPTRPHWAEPLHQHQPGLIGQSLSTNATPTSTRGLHLVPLTSRPGKP